MVKTLGSAGIAISLVSAFLVLALLAELYYLLWWKQQHRTTVPTTKRRRNVVVLEEEGEEEEESNTTTTTNTSTTSPAKELLSLFCWKKPTALNRQDIYNMSAAATSEDNNNNNISNSSGIEAAEFMRLRSLSSGLPRFLFTIKEETKEDLESENGIRKSSRGRSISTDHMLLLETFTETETPYLTPLSSPAFFTPPLTPMDNEQGIINPLFESFKRDTEMSRMKSSSSSSSPPPKFKFMRDADEKLYRKIPPEEATRVHRSSSSSSLAAAAAAAAAAVGTDDSEDGSSFITIVIGMNQTTSSQVNPLPSPPSIIRPAAATTTHGKLISYFGANQ